MKLLYFLEPYVELERPLFRMGTIRNHLDHEIRSILQTSRGTVEAMLMCSEHIAAEIRAQGYLAEVPLAVIRQEELQRVYPSYLEASARWYNRTYGPAELEAMAALARSKTGAFRPDVIVCYESSAPFLEHAFPEALLLHNTLGMLSRAPYPETSCLDPFGIGKDAFLRRFGDRIRGQTLTGAQEQQIENLKNAYRRAVAENSPVRRSLVRQGFERVVLLPLQVSRYFMFDENGPENARFETQLDLVRYVLERMDGDVGVLVTMHGAEDHVMTPDVLEELKREFPNFLHSPELQRVRWVSQHLLPHVDGVVTVSSSVGLQALIWDLPVFVVGRSHVAGIADATNLTQASAMLRRGEGSRKNGALYWLLTHYYPLLQRYHHDPDWFYGFLSRSIEKRRAGALGFDFFELIDEPARVFDALRADLRVGQLRADVTKAASHLTEQREDDDDPIKAEIDRADVVSFDVFDTLIMRRLAYHRTVFDLVEAEVAPVFAGESIDLRRHGGYAGLRQQAGAAAKDSATAAGSEEMTFASIFDEMRRICGLSGEGAARARAAELDVERRVHRARRAPQRLLQYARERGKRIIFMSDMYLDPGFVSELLQRNGVGQPDRLYVSSEHGVLKKTGNLFRLVKNAEGQDKSFLHIGDNHDSDVVMAEKSGFRAVHLPGVTDRYLGSTTGRRIWSRADLTREPGSSLLHGVISTKFHDDQPDSVDSWCGGSPYRLGYEAGGPIFLAFVQWIIESARRDGVERLYFLARDGYLPKEIYDLITAGRASVPESHYLFASRRAYNTAAIQSKQDLFDTLSLRFSATSLQDFLQHRFAVRGDELAPGSLEQAGFHTVGDIVDGKKRADGERLRKLLSLNLELILRKAAVEREALLAYLEREGITRPGRRYVVDIGHNASLQKSLGRLLGDRSIGGYYFATFYPARKVLNLGHPVSGYLMDFEENIANSHPYCRSIGMFEFLFLPAIPSFVRIVRQPDGSLAPELVAGDESARFRIIREVHRGVLDFCRDVYEVCGGHVELFEISKETALRRYNEFCLNPYQRDARMLSGVSFVDALGGNTSRYLIATPKYPRVTNENFEAFVEDSWWRPGARKLITGDDQNADIRSKAPRGSLRRAWEHKLEKLRENPWQFVVDMRVLRPMRPYLQRFGREHGLAEKTRNLQAVRKMRKLIRDPAQFVVDSAVLGPLRAPLNQALRALRAGPGSRLSGSFQRKLRKLRRNPRAFVLDIRVIRKLRRTRVDV
jgi:FMN phosphatase YigB (HAD superfamily)